MTGLAGLAGHTEGYTHVVWMIATLLGGLVLVALWVTYRWARAEREVEEAERVIAEAFDELDRRA